MKRQFLVIFIVLMIFTISSCKNESNNEFLDHNQELMNNTYFYRDVVSINEIYKFDEKKVYYMTWPDYKFSYITSNIIFDNDNLVQEDFGYKSVKPGETNIYYEIGEYSGEPSIVPIGYFANIIIAEEDYSNFTPINSVDELYTKLSKNKDGYFVLKSDLDFSNKDFKTIEDFNGVLVNPYSHVIKNINTNKSLFIRYDGFIKNLVFEDCTFTSDSKITNILFENPLNDNIQLTNIKFKNCTIDVSNCQDSYPIIQLGNAIHIENCSFEGKIIANGKPVEFRFYGNDGFTKINNHYSNRISVIDNSYAVVDMTDAGSDSKCIVSAQYRSGGYFAVLGDATLYTYYFNTNKKSYIYADAYYSIIDFYKPGIFMDVKDFTSGDMSLFPELGDYIFEVGKFPYLE